MSCPTHNLKAPENPHNKGIGAVLEKELWRKKEPMSILKSHHLRKQYSGLETWELSSDIHSAFSRRNLSRHASELEKELGSTTI